MCHNLSDNLGFFLLMKGQETVDANGQETVGVHAQVIQFMPPDHVADRPGKVGCGRLPAP